MAILGWVRGRRFRKAVSREVVRELRSQGVATGGRFAAWLDGAVQSGQVPMHFSPREATKLTAAQAGLNLLSWGVAESPLAIYEVRADGEEEPVSALDPEVRIIAGRWSEFMTSMDGVQHLLRSAILHGKGAAWVRKGGDSPGIYPLDPGCISRYRIGNRLVYQYSDPFTATGAGTDVPFDIPRDELIYLPFEVPDDGVTDTSPFEQAWPAVRAALAAQQFAADYYARGATASTVFSSETADMSRFKQALEAFWNAMDRMRAANRREALVPDGYKPHKIGGNAREAELSEQRTFGAQEVARILGVPAQVLEPSTGTYSNFATSERFLAKPIRRWAKRLAAEISNIFWPGGTRLVRFDTSRLVEEPYSVMVDTAVKAVEGGLWTPNGGRDYLGQSPVNDEGADELKPSTAPRLTLNAGGGDA